MPLVSVFAKRLSANDLGATGGHQVGVLVPKAFVSHFPALDSPTRNPRAPVRLMHGGQLFREGNFIYYNNRRFGGTRDEYRVTPFRPADYERLGAKVGDILLFKRVGEAEYEIELIPGPSARAAELRSWSGRQTRSGDFSLSEDTIGDYNRASEKIEAGDFSVSDTMGRVKQRRYQDVFRDAVATNFRGQCCVPDCPVDDLRILDATHIRPWSADARSRLDPSNGLLLCKNHHAAFDQGLFTIEQRAGRLVIVVATRTGTASYADADLRPKQRRPLRQRHRYAIGAAYLQFHRNNCFLG